MVSLRLQLQTTGQNGFTELCLEMSVQLQVGELKKALQEAEGAAEQLQDRADAAEDALAEGRADLARQTATNKALLAKLAASRVSGAVPGVLRLKVYP